MKVMPHERIQKYSGEHAKAFRKRNRTNRHHLTPKSRGGKGGSDNLLRIQIPRHVALHRRFKNMTIEEIRDELRYIFAVPRTVAEPETFIPDFIDRLCRMKQRCA